MLSSSMGRFGVLHGRESLHDIALDEGNYILRLAVRDERTGLMGSENAPLKVGPINGPK
jgi:hypothetical protein